MTETKIALERVRLIKELEKIRIRITQIYMELGNSDYVEVDSVLSQDIKKLEEQNMNELDKKVRETELMLKAMTILWVCVAIGLGCLVVAFFGGYL